MLLITAKAQGLIAEFDGFTLLQGSVTVARGASRATSNETWKPLQNKTVVMMK